MDLLFGTYHQENVDVNFCWVSISPDMAEGTLKKIEVARKAKQEDKDFVYMAFHSDMSRFYSNSDLESVGFDDTFLEGASESHVELGRNEVAMIEKADDSGVDSTKIIVWSDGDIVWHAYYGDGNLVESYIVSKRKIEEIALQHPKHLLKILAFSPKNLV